jgi:CspA family cold shock protein
MNYPLDRHDGHDDSQRVAATVKWFNRSKGFGFVTAADGSGDVFLPAAILALCGHDEVDEGATVICDVVAGPKGRAVAGIHEIDLTTATPRPPRRGNGGGDHPASGPTETMDGVVKWFDLVRGFGFISPYDGSRDVFVHASALRRSGVENLTTGQTVQMEVQQARRGREVVAIALQ